MRALKSRILHDTNTIYGLNVSLIKANNSLTIQKIYLNESFDIFENYPDRVHFFQHSRTWLFLTVASPIIYCLHVTKLIQKSSTNKLRIR